jgi:hypothetical protein
MAWEATILVVAVAVALSTKTFLRLFSLEYSAAMGTRRAINESRRRAEAKLRAKLKAIEASRAFHGGE